jgi:uncharacterized protein (DUF885 family)
MRPTRGAAILFALTLAVVVPSGQAPPPAPRHDNSPAAQLALLVDEGLRVSIPTRSADEYARAAAAWHSVLDRLRRLDRGTLSLDDQIDYDLLDAHVRTRLYEIEELRSFQVDPVSYYALYETDELFTRPNALGDAGVRAAVAELRRLPAVLANARRNLTNPARTWTENAIYQADYAHLLLDAFVPQATVEDAALRADWLAAARDASRAVTEYADWLQKDLLPRSTRPPTWRPADIEFYQFVHEQLDGYGVDAMIRIASAEERALTEAMSGLARRIHPSGDLRRTWEAMKDEAPPWDEVLPMAQRYVTWATTWLHGPGAHVVTIPDDIDYGARITTPMARRILSFGGATAGPTVAGRRSGYYVLTPLEDRLTPAERASRIRSYNPYWTHVISYHEWLGHTVQIAAADARVTRPIRRAFNGLYFSQAWSFYLEKLLEDEGYYQTLPYMEGLKTSMARLQMRMWRVQRILTKCRMAKGEMTFDQAVDAYVDKIGMERTNAFIEVQRDSQNATPPGREIIGELAILQLRDEYQRRMGEHYSLRHFNDALITYGDLPFRQIRRLMFRE